MGGDFEAGSPAWMLVRDDEPWLREHPDAPGSKALRALFAHERARWMTAEDRDDIRGLFYALRFREDNEDIWDVATVERLFSYVLFTFEEDAARTRFAALETVERLSPGDKDRLVLQLVRSWGWHYLGQGLSP